MPLHAKLSLSAYVISGERSANRPKQLRNDAFHVKASQSAKNQLDPAKNENWPKFNIRPFCTKPFNCDVNKNRKCKRKLKLSVKFKVLYLKSIENSCQKQHQPNSINICQITLLFARTCMSLVSLVSLVSLLAGLLNLSSRITTPANAHLMESLLDKASQKATWISPYETLQKIKQIIQNKSQIVFGLSDCFRTPFFLVY